jgi:hypothetical protein
VLFSALLAQSVEIAFLQARTLLIIELTTKLGCVEAVNPAPRSTWAPGTEMSQWCNRLLRVEEALEAGFVVGERVSGKERKRR